jgi:penicillin-insensitive murein endopeptidase
MLPRLSRSLFAAATSALLLLAPLAAHAAHGKAAAAASDGAKKDGDSAKKGAKKGDAKDTKDAKKDDAKQDDASDGKKSKHAKKDDPKSKAGKKDDAKHDDVKGPASIGAPNKGHLAGAVKLHSSRSLKVREHANAWGLPQLVKLLQRSAGKVAKHHAKSVMLVGDLSQKGGGALTGHNSHQTGRDADVGFYIMNSKGQAAAMKHFVAFDGSGKSSQVSWAQFDDARNWTLIEALLNDKDTAVRYIFVSNPLRARLLAFAAKKKVAKDLYTKAETVLLSPHDADVHDDHFHVRIACPDSMKTVCIEESLGHPPPSASAPAATAAPASAPAASGSAPAAKTGDAKPESAPKPDAEPAKPAAASDAKPAAP